MMRRSHILMLAIFAILAIEGCRRGGGVARPPVNVKREIDFMNNPDEFLLDKAAPKRVVTLDADLPRGKGGFEFPAGTFDADVTIKWVEPTDKEPEKKPIFEQLKKQYEVQKDIEDDKRCKAEVEELGQLFLAFCAEKEVKDRSFDNFRMFVRRAKKGPALRLLNSKEVEAIMDADPNEALHIFVYHTRSVKDVYAFAYRGKKDALVVAASKREPIDNAAKGQRLQAIHRAYMGYVNTAGDPQYNGLLAHLKGNINSNTYEACTKGGEIKLLDPAKLPKKKAAVTIAAYSKEDGKEKTHLGISSKKGLVLEPTPLSDNYK